MIGDVPAKWLNLSFNKTYKRGFVPLNVTSVWRKEMGYTSVPWISNAAERKKILQ
jgi:hypothetical protein